MTSSCRCFLVAGLLPVAGLTGASCCTKTGGIGFDSEDGIALVASTAGMDPVLDIVVSDPSSGDIIGTAVGHGLPSASGDGGDTGTAGLSGEQIMYDFDWLGSDLVSWPTTCSRTSVDIKAELVGDWKLGNGETAAPITVLDVQVPTLWTDLVLWNGWKIEYLGIVGRYGD